MRPHENHTPFVATGLGLTLAILAIFQIYLWREPGRIQAVEAADLSRAQALYDRFMPLETLRDSISLIRVLHDAVTLCGVADMGAHLPLLSASPADRHAEIQAVARALLAGELDF